MKLSEALNDLGRPVAYYPSLARLFGSTDTAIFFAQLFYWTGKQRDPEGWIYKSGREVSEETGITRRAQEVARRRLKRLGVLEEKLRGVPATLHYRINQARLDELWTERPKEPELSVCHM